MIMWDYNMMNCQFEFKNIRRDLKLNLSRRRVYSTGSGCGEEESGKNKFVPLSCCCCWSKESRTRIPTIWQFG